MNGPQRNTALQIKVSLTGNVECNVVIVKSRVHSKNLGKSIPSAAQGCWFAKATYFNTVANWNLHIPMTV